MKRLLKAITAIFAMLLAGAGWSASGDIPFLSGRVVDNAELLSAAANERVTGLLRAHETRTTDQVVVLTVPKLEGRGIDDYAVAVFESWKLGQKGKDNGVLLVIVPGERKMRIEVGYSLEGRLTDLAANRIIRNIMAPRFKAGDFDLGVEEGVRAILAQIRGEADATRDTQDATGNQPSRSGLSGIQAPDLPLTERILFGAFIFGIIGLFTVIGVLTPGMGWFLYLFLIPFWAMFPIIVIGTQGALILLVVYLIAFPLSKLIVSRTAWYGKAQHDQKTKGRASIGGFVLGGASASGSSWSSVSSSSSSGYSGGGGSSGGAGSSGNW